MSTYITTNQISHFISILYDQGKSSNTITSYAMNINKLVLFLNGAELTKDKMFSYKKWLKQKGLKQRTINTYLAAANYFCETVGWQEMKVDLETLKYDVVKDTKHISSSNYKKLVFTALQNDKERLAMMIQVLCHMDLRFCELDKLTMEALNLGKVGVIRKQRYREVKIPDFMVKDLHTYAEHERIISGIIFRTRKGSPIDRSNFRKDIKKLCVLAGVEEELGSIQHVKHVVLDEYPYYGLRK